TAAWSLKGVCRRSEFRLCGWRDRNAADRRGTLFCLLYGSDEPKTPAVDGANQALLLASIAYRPTHSIDAAVKRRFGHGSTAPDRGQQVLPAHHTVAVINQKHEKIESLRFDVLKAWPAAQFPPTAVNGIVFENEQHLARPQPRPCRISTLRHSRRRKNQDRPRKINAGASLASKAEELGTSK